MHSGINGIKNPFLNKSGLQITSVRNLWNSLLDWVSKHFSRLKSGSEFFLKVLNDASSSTRNQNSRSKTDILICGCTSEGCCNVYWISVWWCFEHLWLQIRTNGDYPISDCNGSGVAGTNFTLGQNQENTHHFPCTPFLYGQCSSIATFIPNVGNPLYVYASWYGY